MIKPFKKLRGGLDPLKASDWNRMARIVEGLSNFAVAPPLQLLRTQQGTTLSLQAGFGAKGFFLAEIVADGPGAPGNYADERYWVKQQRLTDSGEADTEQITIADEIVDGALWVTATNLAEYVSGSHDFPDAAGHIVMVYRVYDQTPIARYVFTSLPIVVD